MLLAVVAWILAGTPVALFAATSPVVVVAAIAAAASVVTGTLTYIGSRRGSKDSQSIGLIHEAQEWTRTQLSDLREENAGLRTANAELKTEVLGAREDLRVLRQQVAEVRVELAHALQQHSECEHTRGTLLHIVEDLRAQIRDLTGES